MDQSRSHDTGEDSDDYDNYRNEALSSLRFIFQ